MLVGPVVTNRDRDWALGKCPGWMRLDAEPCGLPEIVDNDAPLDASVKPAGLLAPPCWSEFVAEQVERFERYFAGQRKSYAEWSLLWRKAWWPKSDAGRRFQKQAPKENHLFFRAGTKEFARAMQVATPAERKQWKRFGVAHFRTGDDRLARVVSEVDRGEDVSPVSAAPDWAAGWTPEAQTEVARVRSSPVVSHVANPFIDGVRGTLRPQKGADPAAYVRQLAHHLRDFSPHVLAAAAVALIEHRNETLPGIGEVLKVVRAAKARLAAESAAAAGAVSIAAGDPALAARWPDVVIALRKNLGADVVKSWFGPVQPVRREADVLVLAAPKLHANWIGQHLEQQTLAACRSVWPDVRKLQLERHAA